MADLEPDEIEAIAAAVESLRRDLGSDTEITLFGSRARRDHRPDSDYDILCLLPDDLPRDTDWNAVMDRAESAMDRAVPGAAANIQLVAASIVEDMVWEWPFLPNALRDGIDIENLLESRAPTPVPLAGLDA